MHTHTHTFPGMEVEVIGLSPPYISYYLYWLFNSLIYSSREEAYGSWSDLEIFGPNVVFRDQSSEIY